MGLDIYCELRRASDNKVVGILKHWRGRHSFQNKLLELACNSDHPLNTQSVLVFKKDYAGIRLDNNSYTVLATGDQLQDICDAVLEERQNIRERLKNTRDQLLAQCEFKGHVSTLEEYNKTAFMVDTGRNEMDDLINQLYEYQSAVVQACDLVDTVEWANDSWQKDLYLSISFDE